MKEIDLKQIKSMEELKKELGNKYDEIMYKMNLELFERMDRAVEFIEADYINGRCNGLTWIEVRQLLGILKGSDKE